MSSNIVQSVDGALRIAVCVVLVVSAVAKARSFAAFAASLAALGVAPRAARYAASACLLVFEVMLAVALALPQTVFPGAFWSAVLALALGTAFVGAHLYRLLAGAPASCLCFGIRGTSSPVVEFLRAALVLVGAAVITAMTTSNSSAGGPGVSETILGVLLAVAAAAVLRTVEAAGRRHPLDAEAVVPRPPAGSSTSRFEGATRPATGRRDQHQL